MISVKDYMFDSLKTSVWAPALIRRAEIADAYALVVHKGDPDAGAALIKVRQADGNATLYRPMQNMDGARIWLPKGPIDEREVDAMVTERLLHDPDLWVIEIEDRHGRHFLTEPLDDN